MRIVVIGGGISGLTAGYLARAAGHDVICIDAGAQPGGLIRSERHDGFLCEVGPQAVLDDAPDTTALIGALQLEARALRAAPEARRRFIFARGALHPLPMSPPALLRSGLLSFTGKVRLLAEPIVRRRRPTPEGEAGAADDSETVAAFGGRRLGREAGRTLLNTAAIGIHAADADGLSVAAALPRLAALERQHGSLFRGVMAARKRGKRPGQPLSFPEGLGELTAALGRGLGAGLMRARAVAVERGAAVGPAAPASTGDTRRGGWRITLEGGATASVDADALIVATGADVAADLLGPIVPDARDALAGLPATPIALCCLGFREATAQTMGMDLAAYGFLVARGEEPRLLGCQYESSTFPGRAPPGGVLLRAILGGWGPGFEPDIVDKSDEQIAARALADLRTVAGLKGEPDLVRVWRHPRGIPRYAPGHLARVAAIDAALQRAPNLYLLGHALRGVGVNESIRAATALVRDRLPPAPPG